jgi:hypothetical protein
MNASNFTRRFASAITAACLVGGVAVTGCALPKQPTAPAATRYLPSDWMAISTTDWRFEALPPASREAVLATREAMRVERAGGYYRFYRRYTDALAGRIAATNQAADEAFLVSPRIVNGSLTPELHGTALTADEVRLNRAMNTNQDGRGLHDDWERFWLLDRPTKLSPYPIMSTTGNP